MMGTVICRDRTPSLCIRERRTDRPTDKTGPRVCATYITCAAATAAASRRQLGARRGGVCRCVSSGRDETSAIPKPPTQPYETTRNRPLILVAPGQRRGAGPRFPPSGSQEAGMEKGTRGTGTKVPRLATGCLCNCQIITIGGNFSRVDIDCGILLIIGTGCCLGPDHDGTPVSTRRPSLIRRYQPPPPSRNSLRNSLSLVSFRLRAAPERRAPSRKVIIATILPYHHPLAHRPPITFIHRDSFGVVPSLDSVSGGCLTPLGQASLVNLVYYSGTWGCKGILNTDECSKQKE